ncbi:hypothetical protein NKR23_g12266 [Pleurostoma richardsiae]|uniref:Uncharacterized protein n=1 Tax=Pleurostoma richardsiae TaxID=41990 RepID=A0AA38R1M5_9PEZI|nr:hypothetical protein NKR23_g12266 [Pleurostoma richardsiae]
MLQFSGIGSVELDSHFLTLCLGGKLHLAPLAKTIQKALDIGTGTGIWAIDFADEYLGCEVIGTDLSSIQPSWLPPNLKLHLLPLSQSLDAAPTAAPTRSKDGFTRSCRNPTASTPTMPNHYITACIEREFDLRRLHRILGWLWVAGRPLR